MTSYELDYYLIQSDDNLTIFLTIRNQAAMNQLPEDMRGKIIIIEKPYDMDDVDRKLGPLCD